MMRPHLAALLALALLTALPAQQFGDGNRNFVINQQGGSASSPAPVTVINSANQAGMGINYYTMDPGAPVALVGATTGTIGWFTTATNSVDVGPAGLQILLDGLDTTNPFSPFLRTASNARFDLSLSLPNAVLGTQVYLMMLHGAGTSPDGFWVSQTHQTTIDPVNQLSPDSYASPTGSATEISLADDGSMLLPIGFSWAFYGTVYTECYVNANGNITLGAPSSDFTESVADFAANERRVAVWWDDLNPSWYGSVHYESVTTTFVSNFTVWWENVPEFSVGGLNTFSCRLSRSNIIMIGVNDFDIYIDLARLDSSDGLVGISPGGNIFGPATVVELDYSQGAQSLATNATGYYEQFSLASGNPSDVDGHRIHFDLDTNGYPESVN